MILLDYQLNGRATIGRAQGSLAHLFSFFGDTPLRSIAARSGDYASHRLNEGAAPGTVKVELMMMSRGFTLAMRAGFLRYRPQIVSIRVSNTRRSWITEAMLDSILAHLPVDARDVAEMAYLSGWRKSEVLHLRWENVDPENRVIRLEPGTTKNGDGRVFPYAAFPRLERLIGRRLRKTLEQESRLGCKIATVFHRRGRPMRGLRYSWELACRRADLEGIVFHDLRRSAARNMMQAGLPIQTSMALMGHRTRSMFDRYAIVDEQDLRAGTAKLSVQLEKLRRGRIPKTS